ncbi:Glutamate receptor ionotropic, NMDA 3A [Mizuhopecten yessoensis]|uniref:Glutamate receptor ionotropic, NMDA 3A n=2 Tax=Mizuhopecten yessoensis TaxID=6573 RepID=A0A210Q7T0_MIZYE|nr:Glutamate receptor ionotropic, NMDA 3A [Mizuhopecten yessoensis]
MKIYLILHGLVSLFVTFPGASIIQYNVSIGAVFEEPEFEHFSNIFYNALQEHRDLIDGGILQGVTIPSMNNLYDSLKGICSVLESNNTIAFIVLGSKETVNALTLLTEPLGIPVLGYIKNDLHTDSKIPSSMYIKLEPSWRYMARGLIKFFQANFWFEFLLYLEDDFLFDGFYDELHSITDDDKWNISEEIFSKKMTEKEMYRSLNTSVNNQDRIIVIHSSVAMAKRIFKVVGSVNLFKDVHIAWFITERAYTRNKTVLRYYPEGSLALLMNDAVNTVDLLQDVISLVSTVFRDLPNEDKRLFSNVKYDCDNLSNINVCLGEKLYKEITKTHFDGLTGTLEFEADGSINISNYDIRNLVTSGRNKVWRDMGFIRGHNINPFGIVWPSETISNQIFNGKKRYRIVTNPVKPFVMEQKPNPDYDGCAQDTVCLKIFTKEKQATIRVLRDYENGRINKSNPYEVRCCRGLAIDLLNRLSRDLDFDYTLYIVGDVTYGKEINGSWNGMVKDLMVGSAHMAVAAFSITRKRLKVIDFTHPYFFSGFSVLYSERKRHTRMHAFLEPFAVEVWVAIFISATIGAIAMALFEWNSPFGLNPWGRKRKQNYTLASGLTMVYSVLFGHTVRTKSPKSWPSKVMQNFWAFACIFVIASYTANLAAFIAGKHAGINYQDIYDSRMFDIRVGVLEASAVESIVKKINYRLFLTSQRHHVPKSDEAIEMLIAGQLDAYLGDYPILEYARGNLDPKCQLRLLSQTFGEDGYGIGIAKDSPLKIPLSEKIKEYHEIGYIDDLIDVHFADAECYKQRITSEESRLEVLHHAGLFVMLSVGIVFGIILCFVEHAIYRNLVPRFRKKSPKSCMKSSHLMFFSQRLHRILTSAELVNANESAKEMIGIVKNREFSKLFMKSTIRRNKLADMAKTKRLNRNFLDVVEKAKWMQQMREDKLFGDEDSPVAAPPCITEISLKDVGTKIDFSALKSQIYESEVQSGNDGDIDESCDENRNDEGDWFLTPPHPKDVCSYKTGDLEKHRSSENLGRCISIPEVNRMERSPDVGDEEDTSSDSDDSITEQTELLMPSPYLPVQIDSHPIPNGHVPRQLSLDHNESVDNYSRTENITIDSENREYRQRTASSFNENKRQNHRKRKTWHELNSRRKSDVLPVKYEEISKDDLLLMWKTSEIDLGDRLDRALKEKNKLEMRIAQLDERHQGII